MSASRTISASVARQAHLVDVGRQLLALAWRQLVQAIEDVLDVAVA